MVEIVFSESACGSLKIAQTYGRGKYRGSAISVFIRHENGSVPSSNEMKEAQLQAQEQECIAWENAIPLGGKSSDVYCFDMALSVGDISDNEIGEQRKNVLKKMLSVWFVEDLDYQVEEKIQKIKTTLSSVIERYVAGEEVRIWYSYNPDELCGMYWLMKQLRPLNCQTTIYLVKLPTWEYGKENAMTSKISWGEVSPSEWGNYITLQEKAEPVFLSACAMKWNQLQNENAPLRAMLNGKLQSVSEDIYDSFILREIAEQPEQFKMAIEVYISRHGCVRVEFDQDFHYCSGEVCHTPKELFNLLADDYRTYVEIELTKGRRELTEDDEREADALCKRYLERWREELE